MGSDAGVDTRVGEGGGVELGGGVAFRSNQRLGTMRCMPSILRPGWKGCDACAAALTPQSYFSS